MIKNKKIRAQGPYEEAVLHTLKPTQYSVVSNFAATHPKADRVGYDQFRVEAKLQQSAFRNLANIITILNEHHRVDLTVNFLLGLH